MLIGRIFIFKILLNNILRNEVLINDLPNSPLKLANFTLVANYLNEAFNRSILKKTKLAVKNKSYDYNLDKPIFPPNIIDPKTNLVM